MGAVGADGNLLPAYDAAAKQWGDDWRVPKASEIMNLIDLCTWTWTTNNNVAGYTVTGDGQGATTNGRADSASWCCARAR